MVYALPRKSRVGHSRNDGDSSLSKAEVTSGDMRVHELQSILEASSMNRPHSNHGAMSSTPLQPRPAAFSQDVKSTLAPITPRRSLRPYSDYPAPNWSTSRRSKSATPSQSARAMPAMSILEDDVPTNSFARDFVEVTASSRAPFAPRRRLPRIDQRSDAKHAPAPTFNPEPAPSSSDVLHLAQRPASPASSTDDPLLLHDPTMSNMSMRAAQGDASLLAMVRRFEQEDMGVTATPKRSLSARRELSTPRATSAPHTPAITSKATPSLYDRSIGIKERIALIRSPEKAINQPNDELALGEGDVNELLSDTEHETRSKSNQEPEAESDFQPDTQAESISEYETESQKAFRLKSPPENHFGPPSTSKAAIIPELTQPQTSPPLASNSRPSRQTRPLKEPVFIDFFRSELDENVQVDLPFTREPTRPSSSRRPSQGTGHLDASVNPSTFSRGHTPTSFSSVDAREKFAPMAEYRNSPSVAASARKQLRTNKANSPLTMASRDKSNSPIETAYFRRNSSHYGEETDSRSAMGASSGLGVAPERESGHDEEVESEPLSQPEPERDLSSSYGNGSDEGARLEQNYGKPRAFVPETVIRDIDPGTELEHEHESHPEVQLQSASMPILERQLPLDERPEALQETYDRYDTSSEPDRPMRGHGSLMRRSLSLQGPLNPSLSHMSNGQTNLKISPSKEPALYETVTVKNENTSAETPLYVGPVEKEAMSEHPEKQPYESDADFDDDDIQDYALEETLDAMDAWENELRIDTGEMAEGSNRDSSPSGHITTETSPSANVEAIDTVSPERSRENTPSEHTPDVIDQTHSPISNEISLDGARARRSLSPEKISTELQSPMASKPSSAATRVSSALPERVALVPVSNVEDNTPQTVETGASPTCIHDHDHERDNLTVWSLPLQAPAPSTDQDLSLSDLSASLSASSHSRAMMLSRSCPTSCVEISSLDPVAAARAAAILKVHHKYVQEGWLGESESTIASTSENETMSLPAILHAAERALRHRPHVPFVPKSRALGASTPHATYPAPELASHALRPQAQAGHWSEHAWIELDRHMRAHISQDADNLSSAVLSVDVDQVILQFLEAQGLEPDDLHGDWKLTRLYARVPALQARYLRELEQDMTEQMQEKSFQLLSESRKRPHDVSFGSAYVHGAHSTPLSARPSSTKFLAQESSVMSQSNAGADDTDALTEAGPPPKRLRSTVTPASGVVSKLWTWMTGPSQPRTPALFSNHRRRKMSSLSRIPRPVPRTRAPAPRPQLNTARNESRRDKSGAMYPSLDQFDEAV